MIHKFYSTTHDKHYDRVQTCTLVVGVMSEPWAEGTHYSNRLVGTHRSFVTIPFETNANVVYIALLLTPFEARANGIVILGRAMEQDGVRLLGDELAGMKSPRE